MRYPETEKLGENKKRWPKLVFVERKFLRVLVKLFFYARLIPYKLLWVGFERSSELSCGRSTEI